MIPILAIAGIALSLASLADGISTVHFLKIPGGLYWEGDPIMVWIFGTDTPSPKTVYVRGGAVIAGEIAISLLVSHFVPEMKWIFGVGFLLQAGMHIYEAIRNFKLHG